MAEIKRVCKKCGKTMALDWNQPTCPTCGGWVRSVITDRPPRRRYSPKDPSPPDAPIVRREHGGPAGTSRRSLAGPKSPASSPLRLFLENLSTLGMRSIAWFRHRLPSLLPLAEGGEPLRRSAFYTWFLSECAFVALLALTGWELFLSGGERATPAAIILPRAAVACFFIGFLISRQLLFWAREILLDEIERGRSGAALVQAAQFAASPWLLWFLGVPYLQYHINRAARGKERRPAADAPQRSES